MAPDFSRRNLQITIDLLSNSLRSLFKSCFCIVVIPVDIPVQHIRNGSQGRYDLALYYGSSSLICCNRSEKITGHIVSGLFFDSNYFLFTFYE